MIGEAKMIKIVILHGQSHEGSTCHTARMLAQKVGGTCREFFLPRDFGQFCVGCGSCIYKDEKLCPHHEQLRAITQALDEADVLILASPVYVFHATGAMKALLDHYGYRWMVHRPSAAMFGKQAVCISTAAGQGVRSTNKDMADSLFFWGVAKIYRYGVAVRAMCYDEVSAGVRSKIEGRTSALAKKIRARVGKVKPGVKTKLFFNVMRILQLHGWNAADAAYWRDRGWTGKQRPWKT